jgi:uncharacterized membrane protein
VAAAEHARIVSIGAVVALIGTIVLWRLADERSVWNLLLAAALATPLWLPLPWLLRNVRRAYAALTLCLVPYLVVGLTEAIANPATRGWARACLVLAFVAFAATIVHLRSSKALS